ncbi:MAG TPA: efflux RND transporter periplasmic adaptor subunit [Thermoanaerobaculia bacterium]|jgi:cobalt-zinc-cadmium efflux system membrane fusion protein|nr:efflux RND transporter periplasmic adaptor subunit [Thermoanaerobaculia bacterium]
MTRNRRGLPIAALCLAATLAAGAAGCRPERRAADPPGPSIAGERITYPPDAVELASLSLAAAEPAPVGIVHTTGRLAWDEDRTARVFPPVGGRVRALLAAFEQRVGPGTPLAAIESPDFGQAQADANRAATDLAAAERTLARVRELFEHQAAPAKDLEAAAADRDRAKAESERASSRLALLGGGHGGSRGVDQHYVLRSPIAGVVVDRAINPGLEVRTDAQAPLFVISDPTHLWVVLDVVDQDLPSVRPGLPLALRCNAYPQRVFAGRIEVVGDALDPATRTVKARGSLDNPNRLLKAEMYVDVEIADPARRPALEVPSAAVVAEAGRRFVFVEEGRGRFARRAVTAGAERGGKTVILSGLAAGQRVVVDGSLLLESLLAGG